MLKIGRRVLLVLLFLFLLAGCYSKEEKKLAKQYIEQGKINAINYVKEKYGFNAKIKSVKEQSNCSPLWGCLDSSPSGKVVVKLNANKKDFFVYVTGKEESTDASDDYQIDKIKADLIDFFKNNIFLNLYDYKLEFNSKGIKEYYDNNLKDMLHYVQNIELYYIKQNNLDTLNLDTIENFLKNTSVPIDLINFESIKKYKDYKNAKIENVSLTSNNMKNICIDSRLTFKNGQKEFDKYDNISSYNDEVYVYYYKDKNIIPVISISKLDNLDNYRALYEDLSDKKIEQVTNAYSISKSSSPLYIYFPKEKVHAKSYHKLFSASECYVNGEKKYYINRYYGFDSKTKIGSIGNYYINPTNFSYCDSEVTFTLLKISK